MSWNPDEFGFDTRAVHAGQTPDPGNGAVVTPIVLSSTFVHSEPGVHKGYDYSRCGNPTRASYESCVANLEGARFGFANASGTMGVTTIMHLLESGDHVVAGDDMYAGMYRLFEQVFKKNGICFDYVDMSDSERLEAAMRPETRLVWMETPTNPLMKMVDIRAVADISHAHGALLAVDNTFMSPVFQQPLALGADLVMHSTTKYINGHSDVIGGVIITDDEELAERLEFMANAVGGSQSIFDSYLCLRSLKTLGIRMRAHESNAKALAKHLENHSGVERVFYPGLKSHPQHDLAQKQMSGMGGMISIFLKGKNGGMASMEEVIRMVQAVKVFTLAESLGGVESLVSHPSTMTHLSMAKDVQLSLGITENLIRLSVGIENVEDIIHDIDQALGSIGG
ncbi:MAG: PLP-dependent aspartate aminotransferase family protein [Pseudomonadales bacterium]|nr:PLP-dependent aspartate aminotransferase family protein [Pseudomonadales bacterium]